MLQVASETRQWRIVLDRVGPPGPHLPSLPPRPWPTPRVPWDTSEVAVFVVRSLRPSRVTKPGGMIVTRSNERPIATVDASEKTLERYVLATGHCRSIVNDSGHRGRLRGGDGKDDD